MQSGEGVSRVHRRGEGKSAAPSAPHGRTRARPRWGVWSGATALLPLHRTAQAVSPLIQSQDVIRNAQEGVLDGRPAGPPPSSRRPARMLFVRALRGTGTARHSAAYARARAQSYDRRKSIKMIGSGGDGCVLERAGQSAVSSTSPMGSPVAAAKPMGMGVKVVGAAGSGMGRTGHAIPVSCRSADCGGAWRSMCERPTAVLIVRAAKRAGQVLACGGDDGD